MLQRWHDQDVRCIMSVLANVSFFKALYLVLSVVSCYGDMFSEGVLWKPQVFGSCVADCITTAPVHPLTRIQSILKVFLFPMYASGSLCGEIQQNEPTLSHTVLFSVMWCQYNQSWFYPHIKSNHPRMWFIFSHSCISDELFTSVAPWVL